MRWERCEHTAGDMKILYQNDKTCYGLGLVFPAN